MIAVCFFIQAQHSSVKTIMYWLNLYTIFHLIVAFHPLLWTYEFMRAHFPTFEHPLLTVNFGTKEDYAQSQVEWKTQMLIIKSVEKWEDQDHK